MTRQIALVSVVALLIGALGGFLWWGTPTRRLQAELGEARGRADGLERQLGELRSTTEALRARLSAEETRRASLEEDLSRERAMNSRLQAVVSQGKK